MPEFRGVNETSVMIGGVSCFGVLLTALLLMSVAPRQHFATCTISMSGGDVQVTCDPVADLLGPDEAR